MPRRCGSRARPELRTAVRAIGERLLATTTGYDAGATIVSGRQVVDPVPAAAQAVSADGPSSAMVASRRGIDKVVLRAFRSRSPLLEPYQ
jgi:hypothetical protein